MAQPPRVVVASAGKFHAYHIARAAHTAGHLHRFITTTFDRRETGIPRHAVVEIAAAGYLSRAIAALPLPQRQPLSYWVGDNWFDRAASRFAADSDIYHAFNHQALYGLRAAHRAGAVTIVERASAHPDTQHALLHGEFARYGLTAPTANRRLRDKHVQEYEEADWVMVPSAFVRRTLIEGGVPAAKIRCVPLGVAIDRFSPGPKRDRTFRVLFVGAISLQKGVPYLIDAFRRAALPESELVLVGDTFPDADAFLPRYAGLFRHVRFVPHERLADEYRQASVFVLPSLQEGFGMVVYEAAACAVPVIVSDHVGAEIRDGRDGFVVPIRDAAAIAEKLAYLYEHEAERAAMGESARQLASGFTWEHYQRALLAQYDDIWRARA